MPMKATTLVALALVLAVGQSPAKPSALAELDVAIF